MEIRFIGQGLDRTDNVPLGTILIDSFNNRDYDSFTCFEAFASSSGITGLSKHI